jgi:Replication initiator protein, pSAM2
VSASTPQIAPRGFPARGTVSHAESVATLVGNPFLADTLARAGQPDYFGWLDHIQAAAGCTRPIRLVGAMYTIDRAGTDATITGIRHTDTMPDGHIYKACGNRRASLCPGCARTYQADAYQLLRAGLVGGKGIPATVSRHPAVFATLTAPGFGTVHTRHVKRHTCTSRRRCDCRPEPCHARRRLPECQHGQPAYCCTRHEPDDRRVGLPLCLDCYDHDHQVVWNLFAGELWRRTKQAAERYLARLARQRGIRRVLIGYTASGTPKTVPPVRISHGKAAEFQARGVVHFHALLRLDGVAELDPTAIVAPPAGFTADDITDAIRHAVQVIDYTTPTHLDQPDGWPIAWGEQVDVRTISLSGTGEITDGMVAGYLAKYATKSTEVTGHRSTRITEQAIGDYDPDGEHTDRLINACWRLGRPPIKAKPDDARLPARHRPTRLKEPWTCGDCGTRTRLAICPRCWQDRQAELDAQPPKTAPDHPWIGLRRWAHMLGFGGHFLTKARRYSVTFSLLRDQRIVFRRTEPTNPEPAAGHPPIEETTLIVGTLTFAGTGWHTTADALLANTSAALARERHAIGREELVHMSFQTGS